MSKRDDNAMTPGERAVWAAAFVAVRGEGPRVSAARVAAMNVRAMREIDRSKLDAETAEMLADMLGERPEVTT